MTALYVYGLMRADHPFRGGGAGVGDPPARVRRCGEGPVVAAVSAAPAQMRGKRRDLLAHHEVLGALAEDGVVLPMRFGVAVPDESALLAHVSGESQHYLDLLSQIEGRVELNVKGTPDEDAMVASVLAEDSRIRSLREASRGGRSYDGMLRLGEVVSTAVEARRRSWADQMVGRLRPLAVRTTLGPPVADVALNAAFLVDRARVDEFSAAVDELAKRSSFPADVRLTGPLPPYSFVSAE